MKADRSLSEAQQNVDAQLQIIHKLEAQGRDDTQAHNKLEALLEILEVAQQQRRAVLNTRE